MRQKTIITIPFALALDPRLSTTAKAVYLVLRSFHRGQPQSSVMVSHKEITEATHLPHHTIVKALINLEAAGWIIIERNQGSVNRNIFIDHK